VSEMARILIVDDEKIIRNILQKLLLTMGHETMMAAGSIDAIALVKERRPDVVLLDVMLSGGNSTDVVKSIRHIRQDDDGNKQTAIVMMSAHDNLDAIAVCIQAGADDFLLKPFNAALLKARIDRTLASLRAGQTIKKLQNRPSDRVSESELMLQQAEQEHETSCSNLFHDLNNALTGILMTAEMMLMADLPAATARSVEAIIQSSDQISNIIKTHRAAVKNPGRHLSTKPTSEY